PRSVLPGGGDPLQIRAAEPGPALYPGGFRSQGSEAEGGVRRRAQTGGPQRPVMADRASVETGKGGDHGRQATTQRRGMAKAPLARGVSRAPPARHGAALRRLLPRYARAGDLRLRRMWQSAFQIG